MNQEIDNIESNGKVDLFSNGFRKRPERILVDYSSGRTKSGKPLGVRIWRPWELTKLISAIPKTQHQIMFNALLYTGGRYVEVDSIKDAEEIVYDGNSISLTPDFISKKPKCKVSYRTIRLNQFGRRAVEQYFKLKLKSKDKTFKYLPDHNTWRENLTRWSIKAKIDPSFVSVKSTRKTWECYLLYTYPQLRDRIFVSQGHTELTAMKSYANFDFSNKDTGDMFGYVAGWC